MDVHELLYDGIGTRKYAQPERERRFIVTGEPDWNASIRTTRIRDRYLSGTRVRLRHAHEETSDDKRDLRKLTQKLPAPDGSPGLITTMYFSADEFEVFDQMPGPVLRKVRHSIPPFGIDVFTGNSQGCFLPKPSSVPTRKWLTSLRHQSGPR